MTSLTDADTHISENQFEKYHQPKRDYDIYRHPVTGKLALLCSGCRLLDIVRSEPPPNYFNDLEHAVYT